VELQVVQVLVVLGLVLLRFGDVHASRLALAVGLALQTELLAARVDHRAVVVAHVGREDDLVFVRGLEPLQLHVDVDPSALSDRSLAGGHAPAPTPAPEVAAPAPAPATTAATAHSVPRLPIAADTARVE
jgi:hypothetical protein